MEIPPEHGTSTQKVPSMNPLPAVGEYRPGTVLNPAPGAVETDQDRSRVGGWRGRTTTFRTTTQHQHQQPLNAATLNLLPLPRFCWQPDLSLGLSHDWAKLQYYRLSAVHVPYLLDRFCSWIEPYQNGCELLALGHCRRYKEVHPNLFTYYLYLHSYPIQSIHRTAGRAGPAANT